MAERQHAVESAGYWFTEANNAFRKKDHVKAMLCWENAYNHTENALFAARRELAAERERCLEITEDLAERWEASARTRRELGVRRFLFFFGPYLAPEHERVAKALEAAANGLRTVAYLIREGSPSGKVKSS